MLCVHAERGIFIGTFEKNAETTAARMQHDGKYLERHGVWVTERGFSMSSKDGTVISNYDWWYEDFPDDISKALPRSDEEFVIKGNYPDTPRISFNSDGAVFECHASPGWDVTECLWRVEMPREMAFDIIEVGVNTWFFAGKRSNDSDSDSDSDTAQV